MQIGLSIGMTRAGGGGGTPAWSPADLGASLLVWHDPSDLSAQWQESTRTTPAAVDSAVGSSENKGSLSFYFEQAVGGSRPILRSGSGLYWWEEDGLDDSLLSSAALNLSAHAQLTVCVGIAKESDSAAAIALEFSPSVNTNAGSFDLRAPGSAAANFIINARGSSATIPGTVTGYASPVSRVMTCIYDLSQTTRDGVLKMRLNGTLQTLTGAANDPGVTTFGNYSLYQGRRNNSSNPFTGRIYQLVIASGALSGDDLANLETYVGQKMGITI